jgi:LemA protein
MIPGAAWISLLVALVIPVFFVLMWIVGGYNRLVLQRNHYKAAFAQVDVQLKRRYDLIPKLIETAKGYIHHERGALEAVIAARNAACAANVRTAQTPGDTVAMKSLSAAESEFAGTLRRFLAIAWANPDLKGDSTMMNVTEELTSIENAVTGARQAYNNAAMGYNALLMTFPTNVIAGPLSFAPAELFMLEKNDETETPKVPF